MLKDLFFNIWHDDMGSGWLLFVIILFLICIIILIFFFANLKAKDEKLQKKHLVFLSLILIIMYQIIPASIDLIASITALQDINKAISKEQLAIKASVIPWQKGCYYCKLADFYRYDKNYRKMYESYDIAYKYLKSYKSPCWGISFLNFYIKRDYDTAIEIAKNFKGKNVIYPFMFISNCYLMKNDIKNAELYIDKAIQQNEYPSSLAAKAYILKITGKTQKSIVYYRKAIQLCEDEKQKDMVQKIYSNNIAFQNSVINKLRKQQGIFEQ